MNVVIIVFDNIAFNFNIYSYNPFIERKINKLNSIYNLNAMDSFFADKVKNLYGYPITISMFNRTPFSVLNASQLLSGAEVKTIETFCMWLNCTLKLNTAEQDIFDYEVTLENGNKTGPIGDILLNRYIVNVNFIHKYYLIKVNYIP